jgi:hypothetical protein
MTAPPPSPTAQAAANGPAPIAAAQVGATTAQPALLAALGELLGGIPIVGKPLKVLLERRAWGVLVAALGLVLLLVIYPLVVAYLAAFWINQGLLVGLRDGYVEEVRGAFRVREAANDATTESNKRLDYYFPLEFARSARDDKSFELPLLPMQKVEIRIAPGRVTSSDHLHCGAPPSLAGEGADLMDVFLDDMQVAKVQNGGEPRSIVLDQKRWSGFSAGQPMQLKFRPVAELRAASCDRLLVEVKASILVFKEIYKP